MNMCDASVYRSYDGLVCLSVGWYIWDLPGKMMEDVCDSSAICIICKYF